MIMTHLLSDDTCGLCDVSAVVCEAERGGPASSIQRDSIQGKSVLTFFLFFSRL